MKFIAGTPLSYVYNFSYIETILLTVIGGMIGVCFIVYYNQHITNGWHWIRITTINLLQFKKINTPLIPPSLHGKMPTDKNHLPTANPLNKEHKEVFVHKNRRVVWLWKNYGLIGIALFTPVLLSIPIGTFIAARLVHNKKKIILYMFISVLFWSVLMASLFEIYHAFSITQLEVELLD